MSNLAFFPFPPPLPEVLEPLVTWCSSLPDLFITLSLADVLVAEATEATFLLFPLGGSAFIGGLIMSPSSASSSWSSEWVHFVPLSEGVVGGVGVLGGEAAWVEGVDGWAPVGFHRYLTGMGRISSLEPFAPLGPLYETPSNPYPHPCKNISFE